MSTIAWCNLIYQVDEMNWNEMGQIKKKMSFLEILTKSDTWDEQIFL